MTAETSAPELSWVLPLFRTADQLRELLSRIHAASAGLVGSHEVILVDDACPDGSGAIAESIAARDPRVRVSRLAENRGQDDALREGLRLARGSWIVVLDADLQDPPEAIRQLWPLRDVHGEQVVFAVRTGAYTTPGRAITSQIYRIAISWVGGLPAGACLFALLGRRVVQRINAVAGDRVSLLALIAAAGTHFQTVQVRRAPREIGTSSYSALDRCEKAARSLWQMFAARRLHRSLGSSAP